MRGNHIRVGLKITGTGILVIALLFLLLDFLFPCSVQIAYSPVLYAKNGEVLHVKLSADEKWRIRTLRSEVSPQFIDWLLWKEDRFFYYHPGVNPMALFRALWNNTIKQRRTSGASTITMQVARMLNRQPRSVTAKITEIFRALQIEWHYSKEEILDFYLQLLPYGGNVEGVKSASLLWLNKTPDQLSVAEAEMLTIIPNRPNALHPLRQPGALQQERDRWLLRLKQAGKISAKAYREAVREPVPTRRYAMPRDAPHYANRLLSATGEDVYSFLVPEIQRKAEQLTREHVQSLLSRQIHNAAVMIIHNPSMQIVGYVGSADFNRNSDGGQVDGIRAIRQPGSALKPFLYGHAIDLGKITPKSALYDVPQQFNGFAPENFDQRFHGRVSAEYALSNSLNIPAVHLLHDMGVDEMTGLLIRAGCARIAKDRRKLGLSLALGGCGVSLEEMTTLYAMLANEGKYHRAQRTTADSLGRKDSLLSVSATFMITDMLSSIARPDLPVNWEQSKSLPRIAWKTGTSYGRRDAWSIGYNKEYTIGVWCGNFSGQGSPDLSGAEIATPLLFALFQTIDFQSANVRPEMPATCSFRYVCPQSGLPPAETCEQQVMDYYIPLLSPASTCTHQLRQDIEAKGRFTYCARCKPENGYRSVYYPNLPAVYRAWLDEERIPYAAAPPHNPDCEKLTDSQGPEIVSPLANGEYLLNELEPEPIALRCLATSGVKQVFWSVNDRLVKKCSPQQTVFYLPEEGRIKISCTDDQGRNADVRIVVNKIKW